MGWRANRRAGVRCHPKSSVTLNTSYGDAPKGKAWRTKKEISRIGAAMKNGRLIGVSEVRLHPDDVGRRHLKIPAAIDTGAERDVVHKLHGTRSARPKTAMDWYSQERRAEDEWRLGGVPTVADVTFPSTALYRAPTPTPM